MTLSPSRSDALMTELRHFARWTLSVNCPRCRDLRLLDISMVMARVGAGTLVRDVLPRLRCQTCGTPPDWVKLADGVEGTGKPVRKVQLVG